MSSAWGLQDIVGAACGPVVKLWSATQPQDRTLKFNEGTDVHSLAFSHNNKVLAVAGDGGRVQLYSGSRDGAISNVGQLPADSAELLPASVTAVRFAPNDGHLVGGCEDGTVHIWSLRAEGNAYVGYSLQARVTAVAVHSNGSLLATASSGGQVVLHDFPSGAKHRTLAARGPAINALTFGHAPGSGALLAAASAVGSVLLWDLEAQALLQQATVHQGAVTGVALLDDGAPASLVTCGADGLLQGLDMRTAPGTIKWAVNPGSGPLASMALKHDGSLVALGSAGGRVTVHDLRRPSGGPLATVEFSDEAPVTALAWQHVPHSRSHRSDRHSLGSAASVPSSSMAGPASSQPVAPPGGRSAHNGRDARQPPQQPERTPTSATPPVSAAAAAAGRAPPSRPASTAAPAAAAAGAAAAVPGASRRRAPAGAWPEAATTPALPSGGGSGAPPQPLAPISVTPASSSSEADCGLRVFSPVRLYASPLDSEATPAAAAAAAAGSTGAAAAPASIGGPLPFGGGTAAAARARGGGGGGEAAGAQHATPAVASGADAATPSALLLSSVRGPAMFTPGLGLAGYGDTPGSSNVGGAAAAAAAVADDTPVSRLGAGATVAGRQAAPGSLASNVRGGRPDAAAAGDALAGGRGRLAAGVKAGGAPAAGAAADAKAASIGAARAAGSDRPAARADAAAAAARAASSAAAATSGAQPGAARDGLTAARRSSNPGSSRPTSGGGAGGGEAANTAAAAAVEPPSGDAAAADAAASTGRPSSAGSQQPGAAVASPPGGGGAAAPSGLREDVFKAYVDARLQELRDDVHTMHADMMCQFQQAQADLATVLGKLAERQDQLAEAITELTLTVGARSAAVAKGHSPVAAGVTMIPWL